MDHQRISDTEGGHAGGYGDQSHILHAARNLFRDKKSQTSQPSRFAAEATPTRSGTVSSTTHQNRHSPTQRDKSKSKSYSQLANPQSKLMRELTDEKKWGPSPKSRMAQANAGRANDWEDDSDDELQFRAAMSERSSYGRDRSRRAETPGPGAEEDEFDPVDNARWQAEMMALKASINKQNKVTAAEQGDLSRSKFKKPQ
ncbi:hypothetical protein BGZ63DRAFT_426672 [Mariannaea sp. PMI_226]|nr:hypothetical protein BGZ63DRAFT_426672 [Mariannaea sp. PMI_226]